MGQQQSTRRRGDGGQQQQQQQPEHNGVRLTPALASRLALEQATAGAAAPSDLLPASTAKTIRAAEALSAHVDRDVRIAADKMISKSASLSKALETSRHVNDLLIAREEEELVKIDALSREILEREGEKYGLDLEKEDRERQGGGRCGEEEQLVAGCYREHAPGGGELVCRGLVDAYLRCAFGRA